MIEQRRRLGISIVQNQESSGIAAHHGAMGRNGDGNDVVRSRSRNRNEQETPSNTTILRQRHRCDEDDQLSSQHDVSVSSKALRLQEGGGAPGRIVAMEESVIGLNDEGDSRARDAHAGRALGGRKKTKKRSGKTSTTTTTTTSPTTGKNKQSGSAIDIKKHNKKTASSGSGKHNQRQATDTTSTSPASSLTKKTTAKKLKRRSKSATGAHTAESPSTSSQLSPQSSSTASTHRPLSSSSSSSLHMPLSPPAAPISPMPMVSPSAISPVNTSPSKVKTDSFVAKYLQAASAPSSPSNVAALSPSSTRSSSIRQRGSGGSRISVDADADATDKAKTTSPNKSKLKAHKSSSTHSGASAEGKSKTAGKHKQKAARKKPKKKKSKQKKTGDEASSSAATNTTTITGNTNATSPPTLLTSSLPAAGKTTVGPVAPLPPQQFPPNKKRSSRRRLKTAWPPIRSSGNTGAAQNPSTSAGSGTAGNRRVQEDLAFANSGKVKKCKEHFLLVSNEAAAANDLQQQMPQPSTTVLRFNKERQPTTSPQMPEDGVVVGSMPSQDSVAAAAPPIVVDDQHLSSPPSSASASPASQLPLKKFRVRPKNINKGKDATGRKKKCVSEKRDVPRRPSTNAPKQRSRSLNEQPTYTMGLNDVDEYTNPQKRRPKDPRRSLPKKQIRSSSSHDNEQEAGQQKALVLPNSLMKRQSMNALFINNNTTAARSATQGGRDTQLIPPKRRRSSWHASSTFNNNNNNMRHHYAQELNPMMYIPDQHVHRGSGRTTSRRNATNDDPVVASSYAAMKADFERCRQEQKQNEVSKNDGNKTQALHLSLHHDVYNDDDRNNSNSDETDFSYEYDEDHDDFDEHHALPFRPRRHSMGNFGGISNVHRHTSHPDTIDHRNDDANYIPRNTKRQRATTMHRERTNYRFRYDGPTTLELDRVYDADALLDYDRFMNVEDGESLPPNRPQRAKQRHGRRRTPRSHKRPSDGDTAEARNAALPPNRPRRTTSDDDTYLSFDDDNDDEEESADLNDGSRDDDDRGEWSDSDCSIMSEDEDGRHVVKPRCRPDVWVTPIHSTTSSFRSKASDELSLSDHLSKNSIDGNGATAAAAAAEPLGQPPQSNGLKNATPVNEFDPSTINSNQIDPIRKWKIKRVWYVEHADAQEEEVIAETQEELHQNLRQLLGVPSSSNTTALVSMKPTTTKIDKGAKSNNAETDVAQQTGSPQSNDFATNSESTSTIESRSRKDGSLSCLVPKSSFSKAWKVTKLIDVDGELVHNQEASEHAMDDDDLMDHLDNMATEELAYVDTEDEDEVEDDSDDENENYFRSDDATFRAHSLRAYGRPDVWVSTGGGNGPSGTSNRSYKIKRTFTVADDDDDDANDSDGDDDDSSCSTSDSASSEESGVKDGARANDKTKNSRNMEISPATTTASFGGSIHGERAFQRPDSWVSSQGFPSSGAPSSAGSSGTVDSRGQPRRSWTIKRIIEIPPSMLADSAGISKTGVAGIFGDDSDEDDDDDVLDFAIPHDAIAPPPPPPVYSKKKEETPTTSNRKYR